MYREHFNLQERPFIQAPGERFFEANASMKDALNRLASVLTARDSVALVTGGPGVGKSTLVERAVAMAGDKLAAVRVDMRYGDADDIYAAILLALGDEFGDIPAPRAMHTIKGWMERLAADGKRLALCLDIGTVNTEIARHLLRLANMAGERRCQMNIVLMGPHPLHQQLDLPALIQLRQRVAFRFRIRPLTLAETDRYIKHQVEAVNADATTLLSGAFFR